MKWLHRLADIFAEAECRAVSIKLVHLRPDVWEAVQDAATGDQLWGARVSVHPDLIEPFVVVEAEPSRAKDGSLLVPDGELNAQAYRRVIDPVENY